MIRGGALGSVWAAAMLSACVTVSPCPSGGVAATQCRASRGDKFAQFTLAKAYESGTGVSQDWERAVDLYRSAAAPTSGITYVYSPGVGSSRGRVIPIRTGPDQAGLPEANYRLGMMYRHGKGVERDEKRAADLIKRSIDDGYTPR